MIVVLSVCIFPAAAISCTTFCFVSNGLVIYGGNYDWDIGNGFLLTNPRNVSKRSEFRESSNPAKWTSLYGSITFNQYGRAFPTAGMNEEGLVVQLMMLEGSEYPVNRQPVVGCLEWIQYQLDRSATIADVLRNSRAIRIVAGTKLHYLVCDRSGACVTIEFLGGNLIPHSGSSLPVAVLTNDSYDRSLEYLRTLQGFGGSAATSQGPGSLERFGRAATWIKNLPFTADPIGYAFQILANVAQPDYTKWSLVYDSTNRRIHFRSAYSAAIKTLDLTKFKFSCAEPVKGLSINAIQGGDVFSRLQNFTYAANLNLIRNSYHNTPFLQDIPDSTLQEIARWPDSFTCR